MWRFGWSRDDEDETVKLRGFNIAPSFGVDVHVKGRFWLGGMFRFAFPFWGERCRTRVEPGRTDTECRDTDALDADDQTELTDLLWYTGVVLRVDLSN